MKTPRVTDFDPDAKAPTLKSSLDNMPSIVRPKAINHTPQPRIVPSSASQNDQPHISSDARPKPSPQSPKRSFIRRTFDFYEDQITYLTRESLQERLAGKERSMNEMVREALDDWINKRKSGK